MNQFDRKPTVENCKSELEEVAKELGLPLEDPKYPLNGVNVVGGIMTK